LFSKEVIFVMPQNMLNVSKNCWFVGWVVTKYRYTRKSATVAASIK